MQAQVIFSWIFGLAFLGEATNVVGGMGTVLVLLGVVLVAMRHVEFCQPSHEGGLWCGLLRIWHKVCFWRTDRQCVADRSPA